MEFTLHLHSKLEDYEQRRSSHVSGQKPSTSWFTRYPGKRTDYKDKKKTNNSKVNVIGMFVAKSWRQLLTYHGW